MEERKQKEIEHYDKKAKGFVNDSFNPFLLRGYRFLRKKTAELIENKEVLDYGAGNGIHSYWLAQKASRVYAIDLSRNSLEIAKRRGSADNLEFLVMDAENLTFEDNSFDVVFDGGTLSSLKIERAFSEIARVLKPGGVLIGIETLGHNPIINLKRKINKRIGKRTEWAADHIFKMDDLKLAEKYFGKIEAHYFHPVSWLAFPFLPQGLFFLKILEFIDKLLLAIPFLKRYSFKIVFIFKNPI